MGPTNTTIVVVAILLACDVISRVVRRRNPRLRLSPIGLTLVFTPLIFNVIDHASPWPMLVMAFVGVVVLIGEAVAGARADAGTDQGA